MEGAGRGADELNLFLVGWNLPAEIRSTAAAAFAGMTATYPQLDPETRWQHDAGPLFVASMHPPDDVIAPRRYRWASDTSGCLYDGCCADPEGRLETHDAEALHAAWDRLPGTLEGQFVVIRFATDPARLEVMTDAIGMKQTYACALAGGWLVSGSMGLIHRIARAELDDEGVRGFLSIGWPTGDRTLRRDIRVIPGGECWTWAHGAEGPAERSYFSAEALVRARRQRACSDTLDALSDRLVGCCRSLGARFGEVQSTLTAGRDSRLLAALLINGAVDTEFMTDGLASSQDVRTAAEIARALDLKHVHVTKTSDMVTAAWERASRRLLEHTDGMVSLWQVADVLEPERVDRRRVRLWGAGGEIARAHYAHPHLLIGRPGREDVVRVLLAKKARNHGGLIRPDAMEAVSAYVRGFADRALAAGFTPLDVLDLFQTFECIRRWAGSNARKVEAVYDLFTPFATRAFVTAAFTFPPRNRYSEPIHRALVRSLAPVLERFPYSRGAWRSESPTVNALRWMLGRPRDWLSSRRGGAPKRAARAFDQMTWIEAKREELRAPCLDRSSSPIWRTVDRATFERLTDRATSAEERLRVRPGLIRSLTLFAYDRLS